MSELPLVIRALHERLHFRYRGPLRQAYFDTFLIDLADWKLSLTDQTPCLWVHKPEHHSLSVFDLAEEIRDAVREADWRAEVVLVLVEWQTAELREALKVAFSHAGHFTQFAVIDAVQQRAIAEAASPSRVMQDWLLEQIPLSDLSPYETGRFVTGNRFFGREFDLKQILRQQHDNYLIVGVRRIGKSSLLRELQRRLDLSDPAGEQPRRVYVDCSVLQSEDDFYKEIISQLNPRDIKRFERQSQSQRFKAQLFQYLAGRQGGRITYLLDEVDGLLQQLTGDYHVFEAMRHASAQDGYARFILAGFRELDRTLHLIDTPLYHFGIELTLGPFKLDDVRKMVTEPLDQLRIKLEHREEIVQHIYQETAGHPNLVQFYCKSLLDQLEGTNRRTLSVADLQVVYDDNDFRRFLMQTFLSNTLPLERAIVFAMVATIDTPETTFSLKEIDAELGRRNLQVELSQLTTACDNLVTAGVLTGPKQKRYRLSIPLLAPMLAETYSLDFVFGKARRDFLAATALHPESAS
jgi:hypothetical protein